MDVFSLPRIDDTLDMLAGTKYFTTLDLASGYWQVRMEPGSQEKTAFVTHSGLYEFNVMPFGLCNAPATFQRLMEAVLAGIARERCMVYLDLCAGHRKKLSGTSVQPEGGVQSSSHCETDVSAVSAADRLSIWDTLCHRMGYQQTPERLLPFSIFHHHVTSRLYSPSLD